MASVKDIEIEINKELLDLMKYWKKRCELAEVFIYESPCDPDITNEQIEAYNNWKNFKDNDPQSNGISRL